jgi:DNA-binding response OmpR family regulator
MGAMRILVVDDNEDMRSMLKLCLEADGFDVEVARNGQLALERLQQAPADVVVTDLFMPDQDGIETILELRKRFPEVRIVAMSGWTSSEGSDYLRVAREIGALETLKKPFDPQQLSRLLRALPG